MHPEHRNAAGLLGEMWEKMNLVYLEIALRPFPKPKVAQWTSGKQLSYSWFFFQICNFNYHLKFSIAEALITILKYSLISVISIHIFLHIPYYFFCNFSFSIISNKKFTSDTSGTSRIQDAHIESSWVQDHPGQVVKLCLQKLTRGLTIWLSG